MKKRFRVEMTLSPHWQCVEPFRDFLVLGLTDLGADAVISIPADYTIALNAHRDPAAWIGRIKQGEQVIVYNTEVEDTWPPLYSKLMMQYACAVWHYSSKYTFGNNPSYVPLWLPNQPELLPLNQRKWPMGFYGSINARRAAVLHNVQGPTVASVMVGTYGQPLRSFLSSCQSIISPQYYADGPVCHARIMQALSYGCQVLSEDGEDSEDFPGVYFCAYENLVESAKLIAEGKEHSPLVGTDHLREMRYAQLADALRTL